MKLGIIGMGAIGTFVRDSLRDRRHDVAAVLVRPERMSDSGDTGAKILRVDTVTGLPDDLDMMIDCAGHSALRMFGPDILRGGTDLLTVSLGALADPSIFDSLQQAARDGGSHLYLASGAIGALDCLRAAKVGKVESVTYVGRKPPQGWLGSPAETRLNLEDLSAGAQTHFSGSARNAALEYPKNANVAAAVALAGIGFDDTRVELVSDPGISENIHEIQATGDFGSFSFEIRGNSLLENPRTSALAAMSVVSRLEQASRAISF